MLEELCNIFKPYFDMLNTSTFRLISGVSGVVISGVYSLSSDDTVLEFKKIGGDADNRNILHYNSTTGLLPSTFTTFDGGYYSNVRGCCFLGSFTLFATFILSKSFEFIINGVEMGEASGETLLGFMVDNFNTKLKISKYRYRRGGLLVGSIPNQKISFPKFITWLSMPLIY